jgi:hypothetical protein
MQYSRKQNIRFLLRLETLILNFFGPQLYRISMDLSTGIDIVVLVLTIPCAIAAIVSVWVLLRPNRALLGRRMFCVLCPRFLPTEMTSLRRSFTHTTS